MKLVLHKFDLRLTHTFKIAHDSRSIQKTLIVEIQHDGISGFGEATASNFYHISFDGMEAILSANKLLIESYNSKIQQFFGIN